MPSVTRSSVLLQLIQQTLEQSTLTIHLFGRKGNQRLYSKDFYRYAKSCRSKVPRLVAIVVVVAAIFMQVHRGSANRSPGN